MDSCRAKERHRIWDFCRNNRTRRGRSRAREGSGSGACRRSRMVGKGCWSEFPTGADKRSQGENTLLLCPHGVRGDKKADCLSKRPWFSRLTLSQSKDKSEGPRILLVVSSNARGVFTFSVNRESPSLLQLRISRRRIISRSRFSMHSGSLLR